MELEVIGGRLVGKEEREMRGVGVVSFVEVLLKELYERCSFVHRAGDTDTPLVLVFSFLLLLLLLRLGCYSLHPCLPSLHVQNRFVLDYS